MARSPLPAGPQERKVEKVYSRSRICNQHHSVYDRKLDLIHSIRAPVAVQRKLSTFTATNPTTVTECEDLKAPIIVRFDIPTSTRVRSSLWLILFLTSFARIFFLGVYSEFLLVDTSVFYQSLAIVSPVSAKTILERQHRHSLQPFH